MHEAVCNNYNQFSAIKEKGNSIQFSGLGFQV